MVKVLYFAELKEILDKSTETVMITDPVSVDIFIRDLMIKYPILAQKSFQIAVNESFAMPTDVIEQHDTIALIPPVSGG